MNPKNRTKRLLEEAKQKFEKYPRQQSLPPLLTTLPTDVNPFHFSHQKEINQWVDWLKDYSMLSDAKYGLLRNVVTLTATFYPTCTDLKRYENLVKTMIGFFIIDDHSESAWGDVYYDEKSAQEVYGSFNRMLDKLVSKEFIALNDVKPYIQAMYAVFESICSQYNHVQKDRLVRLWRDYIQGNDMEQSVFRNRDKLKSVEQLEEIRIKSIGGRPSLQFMEYADNICLTEDEWLDPRLQLLMDLVCLNCVYSNDLYSFEKEMRENPDDPERVFNIITLIQRLENCSTDLAIEKLVDRFKESERQIKVVLKQILNDPALSAAMKQLANKAIYMASGATVGQSVLDRYHMKV